MLKTRDFVLKLMECLQVKLPNKKYGFTVLSDEYVQEFIEQAVNKAISKWAQKESKIRAKVAICIQIDGFSINNDGFCFQNDEF